MDNIYEYKKKEYIRWSEDKYEKRSFSMLKVTKYSVVLLVFYILFYLQVWGDNHIVLYGSAILIVLSLLIYCLQTRNVMFSNVPFGIWNNLVIVVYSLITGVFVSYNYFTVIKSSLTLAAFSIVCIAICYISSEENSFDWFLKVIIVLAILCSFFTLFYGVYRENYGKTMSMVNNPHTLAAVMNLAIFAVAYLLYKKEKKYSFISWLLILLFYYTIINSGSRKYLISSSIILLLWMAATFRASWEQGNTQHRIITIIIYSGLLIAGGCLYHRYFIDSILYFRMNSQFDLGNQNRIAFYQKAIKIFIEHPIFGGGYDQFQFWSGLGSYAHSTYAEALADFGAIGCLLYFLPIVYAISIIIRRALISERNYRSRLLLAMGLAEVFLGIGQIFFMEFSHFLSWTILFYENMNAHSPAESSESQLIAKCRYFRI